MKTKNSNGAINIDNGDTNIIDNILYDYIN